MIRLNRYLLLDLQNAWLHHKWKRLCKRKLPALVETYLYRTGGVERFTGICEAFEGVSEDRLKTALRELATAGKVEQVLGGWKSTVGGAK